MFNQTKIKIIQDIYRSFKKLKKENHSLSNERLLKEAIALNQKINK